MKLFDYVFQYFKPRCEEKQRGEYNNIVQSMARCKKLHKQLSILAHPDKHPDKCLLATEIMNQINVNRFNYTELTKLQKRIDEELCN